MKKLVFTILFLFMASFCMGQELQAQNFFAYLQKVIRANDSDSILIKTIEYGCLGSEIHSFVKINKLGNIVEIKHYHYGQIPINSTYEERVFLDTSFSVSKSELIQKLKEEVVEIKTRPIFLEANFKITLEKSTLLREFAFSRGHGLYYIFRYNKGNKYKFPKR